MTGLPVFLAVNIAAGIALLAVALAGVALAEVVHRRADAAREHRRPITIRRGSRRGRTCYRWHLGQPPLHDAWQGHARTRLAASLAARVTRRRDTIVDWRASRARARSGRTWTIR